MRTYTFSRKWSDSDNQSLSLEIRCLAKVLPTCCQRPLWHYQKVNDGIVLPTNIGLIEGVYHHQGNHNMLFNYIQMNPKDFKLDPDTKSKLSGLPVTIRQVSQHQGFIVLLRTEDSCKIHTRIFLKRVHYGL